MRRSAKRYGVVWLVWVVMGGSIAAGQQAPGLGYCQTQATGIQHGDALSRVCEFSLTLRKKLPDVICQRTLKSYNGNHHLLSVVKAEVRHENGHDSYSNITRNGKPYTSSMSQLPGSGTLGEFGSVLEFLFTGSSRTRFIFEKETHSRSGPALLFRFRLAAENNHGWYVEAYHHTVRPGFRGKLWIDKASNTVSRVEMEAEDLDHAAEITDEKGGSGHGSSFPLKSAKLSVEYANQHLGDGSEFVLPVSSEDEKCLSPFFCFEDRVAFQNCHKFSAKARIVQETPQ